MNITWVTLSGWSRFTHKKHYSVNVSLVRMDFLVVDAAISAARMGRGAHRAGAPARQQGLVLSSTLRHF
eukprot:7219536-Pyramimonas_sp.AAC.1